MRVRWSCLSFFVAALTLPPVARAEDGKDDSSNVVDDRARELFVEGDRDYAEGDYESALTAFEKSYALSHRHALLYNMANAHERLGQYQKALEKLRKFRPYASGAQLALLDKRMRSLQERANEKNVRPEEPKPVEPVQSNPPDGKPGDERRNPTEVGIDDEPAPPYLGYGLVGVGAIALGLGTYFGVRALDARSTAGDRCPEVDGARLCTSDAQDAVDRDELNSVLADVSIGAGIASAAVGILLILTHGDTTHETHKGARVNAAPRRGGGEIDVVVRF